MQRQRLHHAESRDDGSLPDVQRHGPRAEMSTPVVLGTTAPRDILSEDVLLVAPTLEPLDLDEVKKQRRFSATTLDTRFDAWISAARQQFEEETNLQLMTATWQTLLDTFPCSSQPIIMLGRAPVQSIVSVEYVDASGVLQAMDAGDYEIYPPVASKAFPSPSGVRPTGSGTWPTATDRAGSVRVTYLAGYGDAPGDIPEGISNALMLYVGDFHRWSENMSEKTVSTTPLGSIVARRKAAGMMRNPRRMTRW